MKDKFNKYCAEVMGYEIISMPISEDYIWATKGLACDKFKYNPYDDLNQSIPVADVLLSGKGVHLTLIDEEPIEKQIKDFIISTMPEPT
jgi:hypothetical protein